MWELLQKDSNISELLQLLYVHTRLSNMFHYQHKEINYMKKDTDMETKDELHMDINTDNNVRSFTQVTGDLC